MLLINFRCNGKVFRFMSQMQVFNAGQVVLGFAVGVVHISNEADEAGEVSTGFVFIVEQVVPSHGPTDQLQHEFLGDAAFAYFHARGGRENHIQAADSEKSPVTGSVTYQGTPLGEGRIAFVHAKDVAVTGPPIALEIRNGKFAGQCTAGEKNKIYGSRRTGEMLPLDDGSGEYPERESVHDQYKAHSSTQNALKKAENLISISISNYRLCPISS